LAGVVFSSARREGFLLLVADDAGAELLLLGAVVLARGVGEVGQLVRLAEWFEMISFGASDMRERSKRTA